MFLVGSVLWRTHAVYPLVSDGEQMYDEGYVTEGAVARCRYSYAGSKSVETQPERRSPTGRLLTSPSTRHSEVTFTCTCAKLDEDHET